MAEEFDVGGPLPEESSNRTFVIAAVSLGGLLVLSMICLLVYALVLAPQQQEARATDVVLVNQQNTEEALTQTAVVVERTPSRTPIVTELPDATATVTPTLVVVVPTFTPTPASWPLRPGSTARLGIRRGDGKRGQQESTEKCRTTDVHEGSFQKRARWPGLLVVRSATESP